MSVLPSIVELRQYTLHPGRRDVLIELFEREFVESQEDTGMTLIGQFRDLDDPDRFVWLRGFADMEARREQLDAFYSGLIWQAHREAANATMIDSDDVLLVRPLDAEPGFILGERAARGATGAGPGALIAGVHRLSGADDDLPEQFRTVLTPRLATLGLSPAAVLMTEGGPNTFPRLPVREGEVVLVWLSVFADQPSADAALAAARADPELAVLFDAPLQIIRLQPTARSRLHG